MRSVNLGYLGIMLGDFIGTCLTSVVSPSKAIRSRGGGMGTEPLEVAHGICE